MNINKSQLRPTLKPPLTRASKVIKFTIAGAVGGGLFGIAFGAIASFFDGGPTLLTGINESWWWFSLFGMTAGLIVSLESEN